MEKIEDIEWRGFGWGGYFSSKYKPLV